ncbi:hypothetical protein H9P43_009650 [Blastocladiella emersonii ATCC 22665]|nr:hypothetical protein H9P43_009650 [Blastocladiella emersonii ATCC 22665]
MPSTTTTTALAPRRTTTAAVVVHRPKPTATTTAIASIAAAPLTLATHSLRLPTNDLFVVTPLTAPDAPRIVHVVVSVADDAPAAAGGGGDGTAASSNAAVCRWLASEAGRGARMMAVKSIIAAESALPPPSTPPPPPTARPLTPESTSHCVLVRAEYPASGDNDDAASIHVAVERTPSRLAAKYPGGTCAVDGGAQQWRMSQFQYRVRVHRQRKVTVEQAEHGRDRERQREMGVEWTEVLGKAYRALLGARPQRASEKKRRGIVKVKSWVCKSRIGRNVLVPARQRLEVAPELDLSPFAEPKRAREA